LQKAESFEAQELRGEEGVAERERERCHQTWTDR